MVRLLPRRARITVRKEPKFQSHNGAIAAREVICNEQRLFGFNPTMVRLLRRDKAVELYGEDGFNPTMVRLLHCAIGYWRYVAMVSIPQWCDCCAY